MIRGFVALGLLIDGGAGAISVHHLASAPNASSVLAWATIVVTAIATVGLPFLMYRLNKHSEERMTKAAEAKAATRVEDSAAKAATKATEQALNGMQDLIADLQAEVERVRGQLSEADMQLVEKNLQIGEMDRTIARLNTRMTVLQTLIAENWQLAHHNARLLERNDLVQLLDRLDHTNPAEDPSDQQ